MGFRCQGPDAPTRLDPTFCRYKAPLLFSIRRYRHLRISSDNQCAVSREPRVCRRNTPFSITMAYAGAVQQNLKWHNMRGISGLLVGYT